MAEYAWLGWPLPTLLTGREIAAQMRDAADGMTAVTEHLEARRG